MDVSCFRVYIRGEAKNQNSHFFPKTSVNIASSNRSCEVQKEYCPDQCSHKYIYMHHEGLRIELLFLFIHMVSTAKENYFRDMC